jgi:hypothetical protein
VVRFRGPVHSEQLRGRPFDRITPYHRGVRPLEPRFTRLVGFICLVLCPALGGCGGADDDLPRQALSGTVTLDGQPLELGIIQFQPSSAQEPLPAGAEIKDGTFTIARDEGPTPGNYRVFITSSGGKKPPTPAGTSGEKMPGIMPDLIPAKYNSNSTLTVKVEADKPNTFDFPLKK